MAVPIKGSALLWLIFLQTPAFAAYVPQELMVRSAATGLGCLLMQGSELKCWGYNSHGQLGLGDTDNRGDSSSSMIAVAPVIDLGGTPTHVCTGETHACAVLDDSTLKCWGAGGVGQTGQGDQLNRGDEAGEMGENLPAVDVGSGRTVSKVACGDTWTCMVLDNGAVKCVGRGHYERIGNGISPFMMGHAPGYIGDHLPEVNLGTTATDVFASFWHSCAILTDGSAKCWGRPDNGMLGKNGQARLGFDTIDVGSGRTVTHMALAEYATCVLLDDSTVKCFGRGSDSKGVLGYGDTQNRASTDAPVVDLGTGKTAKHITAGRYHVCALLNDDTLKCWGDGTTYGVLGGTVDTVGDGPNEMGDFLPPVDVGTGKTVHQVSAGEYNVCALLNDNAVKCWGRGDFGMNGLGDTAHVGINSGEMGDNLPEIDFGVPPTTTTSSTRTFTTSTSSSVTATSSSTTSATSTSTSATRTSSTATTATSSSTSSSSSSSTSATLTSSTSSSRTSSSSTSTSTTLTSSSSTRTTSTSTTSSSTSSTSTTTTSTSSTSTTSSSSSTSYTSTTSTSTSTTSTSSTSTTSATTSSTSKTSSSSSTSSVSTSSSTSTTSTSTSSTSTTSSSTSSSSSTSTATSSTTASSSSSSTTSSSTTSTSTSTTSTSSTSTSSTSTTSSSSSTTSTSSTSTSTSSTSTTSTSTSSSSTTATSTSSTSTSSSSTSTSSTSATSTSTSSSSTTSSSTTSTSSSSTSTTSSSSSTTSSSTTSTSTSSTSTSSTSTSSTSTTSSSTTSSSSSSSSSSFTSTSSTASSTTSTSTSSSTTTTTSTSSSSSSSTSTSSTTTSTSSSSTSSTSTTSTSTSSTSTTSRSSTSSSTTLTTLTFTAGSVDMLAAEATQEVQAVLMRKARAANQIFKMLEEAEMSPMNATGNEDDGLLLKLITKGVDGSEIGTYAYRVTDTSVLVEYENAKIELPVPLLRELQTDPDDAVVISLASFTNESFAYKLLAAASEPQGIRLLADPLSLSFFSAEGTVLETTSEDPIRLGLQVLEEDPSAECAFWHEVEQRWSTQGMSVDSLGNGTATCAIRYDLLPVVSAPDGEVQVGDGEVEALRPRKPSLFGFILQAVGATFACSLASQIFSVEGLEALVADPNWVVRWPAIMTWVTLVAGVGLLLQAHRADRQYEQRLEQLLRKEAARDMLIEKAKKENIFFVKLRQLLEIRRQLLGMGARGMVADRAHWSILQARLGVDSTFLHSLYQVSGQTALHIEARQLLENFHAAGLCRRLVALHTAYCSWVRVLEPSLRVTCLERAAVALCKFYSGLAVAAVFYSQSAVAPGQDEGCSIFQDPLAQLIRTAVVAWVSAMVGLLPFLALMPLFEKLRSMELKMRHIIFWSFISTYLLICILVVCIFQSMVSYKDTLDWMYSAAQTLAFSLILTPLLMAAVVLLFVHSASIDLDEHLPFHAKDDHCYKVILRNMTVSGEEWQNQAQRSQLCARWEIAGHPETATITTFQADADGEIELDGVMPYHALLVSIYLRSKSSTLRLLGNAALPSDKFIHSGFDGELPLYLRGKAVSGMQVSVFIARPAISQQAVVQRGRSSIRLTVQGNNVLAAEEELQQELENFGICFEDDDDDAMMPDDDVMPPEVTCQLAGITFDDDVVLESDFQKDCSELGITFLSDADAEDLRSQEPEHDDLSSSVAVVPRS